MIYETKYFEDDNSRKIVAYVPVTKCDICCVTEYVGKTMTPFGTEVSFPFPKGYTLEECFSEFDSFEEKALE